MTVAVNEQRPGMLAQFVTWLAQGFEEASEDEMLRSLDDDTIRSIAGDCGITPDQFLALAKAGPHAADEMPRLMKALGIDPMEVQQRYSQQFRQMQVSCAQCTAKGKCRKDLAKGTAQEHFDDYCRNADSMRWLRATPTVLAE